LSEVTFLENGVDNAARSLRQPPIVAAAVVTDARIISWQHKPDTVHCTSSFTLVFRTSFPDQSSQIRLSLEPNHELLQDATVEYLGADGEIVRTEDIVRHEHKIYKGNAYVRDATTKAWVHCGWTRIMVLRDGENPLFEGVFLKDGDIHHVKLLSKYNAQRVMDDVELESTDPENTLVVYRDSDRYMAQALLIGRSIEGVASSREANTSMCGHDRLPFNIQQNTQGSETAWGWGLEALGRLVRRQSGGGDVGGSLSTGGSQQSLAATIGDTNGCLTTRRVALVAAAADCSYVNTNGNSTSTRSQIINIYNSVCPGLYC
jgi:hypothetical protein